MKKKIQCGTVTTRNQNIRLVSEVAEITYEIYTFFTALASQNTATWRLQKPQSSETFV